MCAPVSLNSVLSWSNFPPLQLKELWHSPQDWVNCPRCTSSALWQPTQVAGALRHALALLVAAAALERRVGALEREVGQAMIEPRAIELNDVGLAALVLRVASAALAGAGIGHAPVKAQMVAHVARDFLVTIETQRGLAADVGAIVAVGAGLLLLHVRAGHFARHQQGFHRCRMRSRGDGISAMMAAIQRNPRAL